MSQTGMEDNLYTADQFIEIFGSVIADALKKLDQLTPVKKTGKWLKYEGRFDYNWECSECECSAWEKTDYCAHCGARMVGNEDG